MIFSYLTYQPHRFDDSQDGRLIKVAREQVSARKLPPGVLTAEEPVAWPRMFIQTATSTTTQSGGGYILARKELLRRYVIPWLGALHHLNTENYATLVFDHCSTSSLTKQNVVEDIFAEDVVLSVVCKRFRTIFSIDL